MEIELIESASNEIAEYNPISAGLAELKRKYGNIAVDVSTPKALDEAKRVRAEIREPRYETEKIRKALKAPALAHAKLIDTEAARITAELLAIETPWDDAIKSEESRKEAEKAAREAAEKARIMAITERIAGIRQYIELAASCRTAARIYELQEKLARVSLEGFEEFEEEAKAVHADSMKRVEALLVEKHLIEQEQERIKAEQAAQAAALKAERESFAAQQAAAKAEADAMAKLIAERNAAFEAETKRQNEAIAAERAAQAAEQQRAFREAKEAQDKLDAEHMAERRKFAEEKAAFEAQKAEAARAEAQAEAERFKDAVLKLAEETPVQPTAQIEQEPEAVEETVEAVGIEPTDTEVMWECIKACSEAFDWTAEQATTRLAAVQWTI